ELFEIPGVELFAGPGFGELMEGHGECGVVFLFGRLEDAGFSVGARDGKGCKAGKADDDVGVEVEGFIERAFDGSGPVVQGRVEALQATGVEPENAGHVGEGFYAGGEGEQASDNLFGGELEFVGFDAA